MTTEPAHLFSDPFGSRGSELKGRTGIIDSLADRLPEKLFALNGLHEDELVPQGDLAPYSAALRAATPQQVEDARHLIIQALDRVGQALQSRRFSLDDLSKKLRARRFPVAVGDRLTDPTEAPDGPGIVMAVAQEIRTLADPALTDFFRNPTRERSGRMVAEMAEAFAEGSIVLRAVAEATGRDDIAAFADAYDRDRAAFAERVEEYRNTVGAAYAEQVRGLIPSKEAIAATAHARAGGFGACAKLGIYQVNGVIQSLGGSDEGVRAQFGRRMLRFEGTNPDQFHQEPEPLTSEQANRLKNAAADILDAYQDLNHTRGFTGYVRQVLCALETDRFISGPSVGLAQSLRSTMEDARPHLGLAPAPDVLRKLVFRPTTDDANVLVGRFADERDGDLVGLLFKRDGMRNKPGVLLAFVKPESLETGIPTEQAIHDIELDGSWHTNFRTAQEAFEWLADKPRHAQMPAWLKVDRVGYVSDPELVGQSPGMAP